MKGTLTVAPLTALARDIAAMFAPLPVPAGFRSELHDSLLTEARQRQARRTLALGPREAEQGLTERMMDWLQHETEGIDAERRWMWSAAAVGSAVSLAGILAYMLRRRGRESA